LIRFVIALILLFPCNGIFSCTADKVNVSAGEDSSLSYHREEFSLSTDELAFAEEIQEEEAVLVTSGFDVERFSQTFACLEQRHWKHVSTPQIKPFFYTNLPPPIH